MVFGSTVPARQENVRKKGGQQETKNSENKQDIKQEGEKCEKQEKEKRVGCRDLRSQSSFMKATMPSAPCHAFLTKPISLTRHSARTHHAPINHCPR